ncbi:MAG TPA: serine hydrolase [Herpetosiphonaceae bacterium]|nr:serine hydrolase [Herpetosiphonaceae bacterium]
MHDLGPLAAQMLDFWKMPGAAVAVIKDGAVAVAEGFGLRQQEERLPVTADTLFPIASATKAFTTLGLGLLVDEGKLDWDTPVREYLPDFKLRDPFASERITPRDLTCHRSGLPRHDFSWYNSSATRRELVEQIRHLEPSKDFRTTWQYQNLMYVVAGYLTGELAGCSWEEFIRQRVFGPLGMRRSQFSVAESQQSADYSTPYQEKDDTIVPIPFARMESISPAGGINSTVADLARWVLLHLNGGLAGDRRIISEANLAQLHAPQMVVQPQIKFDEVDRFGYAMGWFVDSYRGQRLIHHGGNIDGFSTLVSFMPRHGIGLAVVCNRMASFLPTALSYALYDRLLGLDELPWNERFRAIEDQAKAGAEQAEQQRAERPAATLARPAGDFAGAFHNPGYGRLRIEQEDDRLVASHHDLRYRLTLDQHAIFDFTREMDDASYKGIFATDLTGRVASVAIPLEPDTAPIVFERAADESMRQREFLERLAGTYALPSMTMLVTLQGDHALTLGYAGMAATELLPLEGTRFTLKGQPALLVEFILGDDGQASQLQLTYPGGIMAATRR